MFIPKSVLHVDGGVSSTVPTIKSALVTVAEPNQDHTYNSAQEMIKNPRHKIVPYQARFKRYIKVNHTQQVTLNQGTGINSVSIQKKGSLWMSPEDISNTDIEFGNLYVAALDPLTGSPTTVINPYTIKRTYYLAGKNLNVSGYN